MIKYLVEHVFRYNLGDDINIPKFNNASADDIKDKWYFNDQNSMIDHWTKVDISILKDYQQDVNQFSTNEGVSSNWLRDLFHISTTE